MHVRFAFALMHKYMLALTYTKIYSMFNAKFVVFPALHSIMRDIVGVRAGRLEKKIQFPKS